MLILFLKRRSYRKRCTHPHNQICNLYCLKLEIVSFVFRSLKDIMSTSQTKLALGEV